MSVPQKTAVPAGSPKDPSGPHWSKDYVEHLRTIHFSLIAVSLAALVLASSSNPSEITKAREQINAIGDVARAWNPDWVGQAAEHAIDEYGKGPTHLGSLQKAIVRESSSTFVPEPKGSNALILTGSTRKVTYSVQFIAPNWIVSGPVRTYMAASTDYISQTRDSPLSVPEKLDQFRELWNSLNEKHKIRIPVALSRKLYTVFPDPTRRMSAISDPGTLQWVTLAPNVLSTQFSARLELHSLQDHLKELLPPGSNDEDAYVDVDSIGDTTPYEPLIPVADYDEIDFRPQEALIQRFAGVKPVGGLFEHSFPELNKITKNYQGLQIDKFDPILEAEQNRTGESFEAFGVKFPADATTRWGVLVILAVQIYFWIHLQELARKLQPSDPGWEVAFIGMYPSLPSRIVYSISALALPVCGVVGLGVRGLYIGDFRLTYWLLLTAGTILSLTVAIAGWRSAPSRTVERS